MSMTPSLTELTTSISWPSWLSGKKANLDLLVQPVQLQVLDQVVVVDAAVAEFRILGWPSWTISASSWRPGAPD